MKFAREIYSFGSHAGSFEGYVYGYTKVDLNYLPGWVANLLKEYLSLPDDVRGDIQPDLNGTLGRAVRTLAPYLGMDHEVLATLQQMIQGKLPESSNDFTRTGQVQPGSYRELYDFAANAGAFEGYVYISEKVDYTKLPTWVGNLLEQWRRLSTEVRTAIEPLTDFTLGRAFHSLKPFLDKDDVVIKNLKTMLKGKLPASADDFIRH